MMHHDAWCSSYAVLRESSRVDLASRREVCYMPRDYFEHQTEAPGGFLYQSLRALASTRSLLNLLRKQASCSRPYCLEGWPCRSWVQLFTCNHPSSCKEAGSMVCWIHQHHPGLALCRFCAVGLGLGISHHKFYCRCQSLYPS